MRKLTPQQVHAWLQWYLEQPVSTFYPTRRELVRVPCAKGGTHWISSKSYSTCPGTCSERTFSARAFRCSHGTPVDLTSLIASDTYAPLKTRKKYTFHKSPDEIREIKISNAKKMVETKRKRAEEA